MDVKKFIEFTGATFYTGVPDSQLKALCDCLYDNYKIGDNHIIAANEGNALAIAAGHYLATQDVPLVYMQNSGLGNIINPLASLTDNHVYGLPCIFVVGWRGEPGVHDEPQHVYQGMVTVKLLEDMNVDVMILGSDTEEDEVKAFMEKAKLSFADGRSIAFVVRKGALTYDNKVKYSNDNTNTRESIIEEIVKVAGNDIIVSTTGKASRELFEIRERRGEGHEHDFLTVGSMGHASSIALGIALAKPDSIVWVIDGDGAALMHMGAMPVIAKANPKNLKHIVINNGAHETVGGQPTALGNADLNAVAKGAGYGNVYTFDNTDGLSAALTEIRNNNTLSLVEIKSSIGARADLGRPTISARQNAINFMEYLKGI